jgi:hypothetical protein
MKNGRTKACTGVSNCGVRRAKTTDHHDCAYSQVVHISASRDSLFSIDLLGTKKLASNRDPSNEVEEDEDGGNDSSNLRPWS